MTGMVPTITEEFEAQGGLAHKFVFPVNDTHDAFSGANVMQFVAMRKTVTNYNSMAIKLEQTLQDHLSNGEIEFEIAQDIADIFGISLMREVMYRVNVEYTFTAMLPYAEDPSQVVENLSFGVDPTYGTDVDLSNGYDAEVIDHSWEDV